MGILLISYDVMDFQTASGLAAAIKESAMRWARPLASTWLIETGHDASEIQADLAPLLGLDDGLIVQEATATPLVANTVLRWTESRAATVQVAAVIPWPRVKVAEAA